MADITNITLNGTNYTLKASGGGGGESVVELTQAEYDALTSYTPDTTYIITDATPINMDNYATTASTSGIPAMQQDIATLSGSVANKADKANVTARASNGVYWPGWNNQGVITGDTRYYTGNISVNGTNYGLVKTGTGNLPQIYGPTSAGTQNAVLLSNGSGSPVWSSYKFQFITQTAYDALSTKDSTTIYFIVGD